MASGGAMNRKLVGLVLLLIGSEVVGIVAGQYAFRLFDKTVPPAVVTDLVRAGAHGAYVFYGVVLGLAVFAWSLLAAWAGRFFLGSSRARSKGTVA